MLEEPFQHLDREIRCVWLDDEYSNIIVRPANPLRQPVLHQNVMQLVNERLAVHFSCLEVLFRIWPDVEAFL